MVNMASVIRAKHQLHQQVDVVTSTKCLNVSAAETVNQGLCSHFLYGKQT